MARRPENAFSSHIEKNMHINLYAAVLNVKLLHYCFNGSLDLHLNFEIESAHKLTMDWNLNVVFKKSMNLNVDFLH